MTGRRGPRHNPMSERSNARGMAFNRTKSVKSNTESKFSPPKGIDAVALAYWHSTEPILQERGLLNAGNMTRFLELCETQSNFDKMTKEIQKEGVVYKSSTGNLRPNPKVKICERLAARVLILEREFCLTPASADRAPPKEMMFDPNYDPFAIERDPFD